MTTKQGQMVAYIRVSTEDQNLARQQELAERADKVFPEKLSGGEGKARPALKEALEWVRAGDTFVVWSLDRLGRSIIDLNRIVSDLLAKGVIVRIEQENWTFIPGQEIDPSTEVMFNMLGAFARYEHRMIRQRQKEGIAVAKEEGKYKGQKPSLTKSQLDELRQKISDKVSKAEVARQMGISRKTVYRALEPDYMSIEEWQVATGKKKGKSNA